MCVGKALSHAVRMYVSTVIMIDVLQLEMFQVEQLVSAIEGGGATLEEASQRAESYLVDLETRGQELFRVRAEKEDLERKVGEGVGGEEGG